MGNFERASGHYPAGPEGNAEARFKIRGVRRIFFYCNRDGLFSIDPVKGIDDKESGYDDSQERREMEKAADMLFGGRGHHAKHDYNAPTDLPPNGCEGGVTRIGGRGFGQYNG